MSEMCRRPVVVIGAGPIGLAAAAHLVTKGEMFSPWRYNVDPVAGALLRAAGWKEPEPDMLPTGADIVAEYLTPLAALPQIAPTCGSAPA